MTEWWSYSPSDFLMFSPQAYWRLLARHNAAWWPGQLLALAAAAATGLLARRQAVRPARAAFLLLALAWGWLGWSWYWQRYSEIFLAAPWLAMACATQALLLLLAAAWPLREHGAPAAAGPLAWSLLGAALLYPLLAPLTGQDWSAAEVFGFMPEPTALATLGGLVALRRWPAWLRVLLALVPLLSLLLGAATRWLLAE